MSREGCSGRPSGGHSVVPACRGDACSGGGECRPDYAGCACGAGLLVGGALIDAINPTPGIRPGDIAPALVCGRTETVLAL